MNLVKNWRTLALALAAGVWLAGCSTTGTQQQARGSAANPAQGVTFPTHIGGSPELRPGAVTTLRAPGDIWERIRRGYAMPDIDTALVRQQENYYASHPAYIQRMTERSRRYIFHIVEELEQRRMPTELALLPFVESAFNPQAVSSAKAAGLWQFIPSTGANFDLRQNSLHDERRDVVASTRAALDYLERLHGMFGDWHLALAAYNWGEGNVQRAIARNRAAGLGESYLDLRMPNETRHYVPKLQAIKNIVSDPARFGGQLPHIENEPYFESVPIKHDMDVAVAARLAEISVEDFRAINPSQRKPIIFAASTPTILLPWDNVDIFKENLSRTPVSELASWTAWVVPEKLRPADIAQRFGMSEAEFRAMNSIPRGNHIAGGSTVLVPRSQSATTATASSIVDNARLAIVSPPAQRRATVLRSATVRARKGDSLSRIAARYNVPLATLKSWNPGIKQLRVGQSVALRLPKRAASASAKGSARKGTKLAAKGKAPAKNAKASVKTTKTAKGKANTKTAKNSKPNSKAGAKVAKADPKAKAKPAGKTASKGNAKNKGTAKAKSAPAKKSSGSNVKVARAKR
ncbi:MAG: transglycosylase SLT domain-containing protein [Ottowia sp.]|nr:transglycosylase SLT domain-containing protein [Ottowia sp.]